MRIILEPHWQSTALHLHILIEIRIVPARSTSVPFVRVVPVT